MIAITARKGNPHIAPIHDALIFRSIIGSETGVFDYLESFNTDIISNNEVRIRPGVGMIQGRMFCVLPDTYDSVNINNGTQGEKRIDIIACKWTVNEETNTQDGEWVVIQGSSTTGTPVPPTVPEGDLDAGDIEAYMPIREVNINGINIELGNVLFEKISFDSKFFTLDPVQTIPSNADLNDYTDFGCWLCVSVAVAKTLKNCPVTDSGFSLRVLRGTGGVSYRTQEIITYSGNRIYRGYNGSAFEDWRYNLYGKDAANSQGVTIKKVWENAAPKEEPRLSLPEKTFGFKSS